MLSKIISLFFSFFTFLPPWALQNFSATTVGKALQNCSPQFQAQRLAGLFLQVAGALSKNMNFGGTPAKGPFPPAPPILPADSCQTAQAFASRPEMARPTVWPSGAKNNICPMTHSCAWWLTIFKSKKHCSKLNKLAKINIYFKLGAALEASVPRALWLRALIDSSRCAGHLQQGLVARPCWMCPHQGCACIVFPTLGRESARGCVFKQRPLMLLLDASAPCFLFSNLECRLD